MTSSALSSRAESAQRRGGRPPPDGGAGGLSSLQNSLSSRSLAHVPVSSSWPSSTLQAAPSSRCAHASYASGGSCGGAPSAPGGGPSGRSPDGLYSANAIALDDVIMATASSSDVAEDDWVTCASSSIHARSDVCRARRDLLLTKETGRVAMRSSWHALSMATRIGHNPKHVRSSEATQLSTAANQASAIAYSVSSLTVESASGTPLAAPNV